MEIKTFLQNMRKRGIRLIAEKGRLRYRAKKGVITEEILETLRDRKNDILDYLEQITSLDSKFHLNSTSQNRAFLYHKEIWDDYSNRKMDVFYANMRHVVIRGVGEISSENMIKGISFIIERHKVLNSMVEMSGGNLYLSYRSNESIAFQEVIVEVDTNERRELEAMQIANELVWKEFNLDSGPMYRFFLIRLSEIEFIFGFVIHSAIADELSLSILVSELFLVIDSIVSNTPLPLLPSTKYQFMDYLSSMENWLTNTTFVEKTNSWVDQLKSTPATHLLNNGQLPRNYTMKDVTGHEVFEIDDNIARDLNKTAAKLKTSLFMMLLAIHGIAIWRMTAQEELFIIVPTSGRENVDLNYMIGNFVKRELYKINLLGNPNFIEINERLKKFQLDEMSRPVPFDFISQKLLKDGNTFSAPSMSEPSPIENPQNDLIARYKLRALKINPPYLIDHLPFTHVLSIGKNHKGIRGEIKYNKDIYNESIIHSFIDHILKTIKAVIGDPEIKLKDLV